MNEMIDYNVDAEDETWLLNQPQFGPLASQLHPCNTNRSSANNSNSGGGGHDAEEESISIHDPNAADVMEFINSSYQSWLRHNGSSHPPFLPPSRHPHLPLFLFERMMDILEKATAFETIITLNQAERLMASKIPQLIYIFGDYTNTNNNNALPQTPSTTSTADTPTHEPPNKNDSQSSAHSKTDHTAQQTNVTSSSSSPPSKNDNDHIVTFRLVVAGVYNYWVQKRCKLKKPLLRKYWPVTATNDTNPHMVFRPREKEKYKLRKKRQNDMDAFRKMKQLRFDFKKVRTLLDLIRRRERLSQCRMHLQMDLFEQKLYDMTNTSAIPRYSRLFSRYGVEHLLNVPKYFETQTVEKGSRKKRRKRGSQQQQQQHSNADSRSSSPLPPGGFLEGDLSTLEHANTKTQTIAGHDNGTPAPHFLHPLDTRETYATSWDNTVPSITSYVNSHPVPTFCFRHRPRVGRGGRVIIDRLPMASYNNNNYNDNHHEHDNSNKIMRTVFTAGDGLSFTATTTKENEKTPSLPERLVDLLPKPLDHEKINRRIEEICMEPWSDEEIDSTTTTNNNKSSGASEPAENDGTVVLVKTEDWMNAEEPLWGEERFSIGPL